MSCTACGISINEPLTIRYKYTTHEYCCFECAISRLAPTCPFCKCRVIGHGVQSLDGSTYCCHHCLKRSGKKSSYFEGADLKETDSLARFR